MKKEFKIEGMACGHCRKSVENTLNSIPGVKATVSLEPAVAVIEFVGDEIPLDKLQQALSEAGDYTISGKGQ